jgi:hypothetical protein
MNVAPMGNHPRAWLARVGEYASNPTTLGEAKAIAAQMVKGLPADREVIEPPYFLNKWASRFATQPDDKPYTTPIAPKGFKVRLGIMGEHKLQILGCGFRIVTVQLRDKKVMLHHNGNTAVIDREGFKELLAANRAYRLRHAA